MDNPVAVIPARGGSKRIPRKNIKSFCGKPIIHYSIATALKSQLFSEVIVSTDDAEIAKIALREGASVPFLRSKENSDDHTGLFDVLYEAVNEYEKKFHKKILDLCCILPTAPLLNVATLKESFELFKTKKYASLFPVVKSRYPILRSLKVTDGKASMIWPENYSKRSQDLPEAYHDAGQFYWINKSLCFSQKSLFTDNSGIVELSDLFAQDIDTSEDWEIAELKFKNINKANDLFSFQESGFRLEP
jgi:pseudaminic acid cytidylyltransferase